MTSDHEGLHQLLGAFVLGGLPPEEHHVFTRHLRVCASCQREAAQLSGLPALLALVPPEAAAADHQAAAMTSADAGALDSTSPDVPEALLDRLRSHRRWQRRRLGAAAAVLAAACLVLGAFAGPTLQRPDQPPTARYVATAAAGSGAQVQIAVVTKAWGTQLDVSGTGLPTSGTMALWVTDAGGDAYQVATWNGTAAGRAVLTAACAVRPTQIKAIDVRTSTGTPIATAIVG